MKSDTANHIKLDMTPERKARWARVSGLIMDTLEKETTPVESISILDLLRDAINQRYFFGDYKGSHLISTSKRIAESICPGCQTKLDAYSDEAGNTAEPGDLTVCSTCGEILLFTQQMTVERPNPTQLEVIRTDGKVMAIVAAIKNARKERESLKAISNRPAGKKGSA